MSSRIPRMVVPFLAAAILALSVTQVAFGAGALTTAWQAKVGASGVNGTASLATVTTGAGSIGLKLVKLRASSTLPVAVYKGTCASVGRLLLTLAPIRTSASGTASRTNTLSSSQAALILAATAGAGKIAIRVGTGTSAKCGAFAKRSAFGPQAVVQAFYNWYLSPSGGFSKLPARPDLTPGFVRWLKNFAANAPMVGGHDPILCAQSLPDWVKAGPATVSGSTATLRMTMSWNNDPQPGQTVKTALGPAGWQISAVACGP